MNRNSDGTRPLRAASVGHLVFAATVVTLGVLGLVQGDFTPPWMGVPKGVPAPQVLAYLCALVFLVTGLGLLWQRAAAAASRTLLSYLLIWLLVFKVSHIFRVPTAVGTWWAWGATAVMASGASVLYAWLVGDRDAQRLRFATSGRALRFARVLYGLALLPFGVAHFTNLKETVALVPGWLPGREAWAYVTGSTFIAAGLSVLIGVYGRLAAMLSALQMGLFALVVWAPIVAAGPNEFQLNEFVTTVALTAGAWVVAESYGPEGAA